MRAQATRERLLQAAHELLIERAGADPSVSQICARAGVQVAMVSYCFGGKAQLLEALLHRVHADVEAEIADLAARDLQPVEALRIHIAGMVRNFARYPYVSQLNERLSIGPRGHVAAILAGPLIGFYEQLLARDRSLRQVDPRLLYFSIVGLCESLFVGRSVLPDWGEELDDELIRRFTDHTIALVLSGLGAPAT